MNAVELRGKSEKELRDELLALRREQFNLRMQAGINPDAVRSDKITEVRRNIARVKTVMNENRPAKKDGKKLVSNHE
jgi:large subunit ribosomal protein L29